ncbi:hypothetical protein RJT34_32854 [Clitoria ternatea]|uniref:Uncharacterized protein n=1 Tax=Clitoria ternatea TaxID=43366 RepID=A0AAN9I454_CLITE
MEAEYRLTLNDLGDFSPSPEYNHIVGNVDYTLPPHDLALVIIRLTRFRSGDIFISLSIDAVADGPSAFHFVREWAALARGETLETVPFLDRKVLGAVAAVMAVGRCLLSSTGRGCSAAFSPHEIKFI